MGSPRADACGIHDFGFETRAGNCRQKHPREAAVEVMKSRLPIQNQKAEIADGRFEI